MVKREWKKAALVSIVLLILGLALLWPQIQPRQALTPVMPVGAANADELLTPLAEEIVGEANEYGTFTGLDQFLEKSRVLYPELSDETLAGFIARYTGQPELAVEESNALFLLEYNNLTVNTVELKEGYTLTTAYSNTGNDGHNQQYHIWSTAYWQINPAHGRKEILRPGTANRVVYNNHVREHGAVLQQFSCKKCDEITNTCRNISGVYEKDKAEGLEFNYEKPICPGIEFEFLKNTCQNCGSRRGQETFAMAFVKYGVIINGMTSTGTAYTEYSEMGDNSTRGLTMYPVTE